MVGMSPGRGPNVTVPSDVMVFIARNPDQFEERLEVYRQAVKEAVAAQEALKETQLELEREKKAFEGEKVGFYMDLEERESELAKGWEELNAREVAVEAREQQAGQLAESLNRRTQLLTEAEAKLSTEQRSLAGSKGALARQAEVLAQREAEVVLAQDRIANLHEAVRAYLEE